MNSVQIKGLHRELDTASQEFILYYAAKGLIEIAHQLALMNEKEPPTESEELRSLVTRLWGRVETLQTLIECSVHQRTANEQPTADPNPPEAK